MHAFLLDLLPYLLAFYLFEGVTSLRPFQHLLVCGGLRARLRSGRLMMAGLLPTEEVVAAQDAPLLATSRGLYFLDPSQRSVPTVFDRTSLRFLRWDLLAPLAVEHRCLRSGDVEICRAVTPAHARALAETLRALSAAPETGRWALIERGRAEAYSLEPLRAMRARQRPYRAFLRTASFVYSVAWAALALLLASPGELHGSEPYPLGQWLVLTLAVHVALLVAAAALLRRGGVPLRAMGSKLAPLLLPFSAAHALALLSRDLYARWALPALAAALLDREEFRSFARRELVRLAASVQSSDDDPELARSLRVEEQAWEGLLATVGMSRREALAAPAPSGPGAERYCPLCAAEYRAGFDHCTDCGVPLVLLGERPAPLPGATLKGAGADNAG